MAIPTLITDLSTTASSNAPVGSDSPSTLDDIQRAHASFIAQLQAEKLAAAGVTAFAATVLDDANAAAARTTLGAAASGANSDITSLTGLTTPLSEAQGGTGEATVLAAAKTALNASGTAPVYACRAWVNFNGTGTVAIRASGNVSSITDNGVGDYTVNFTTAMVDANYAAVSDGGTGATGIGYSGASGAAPATTGYRLTIAAVSAPPTLTDYAFMSVAIFR